MGYTPTKEDVITKFSGEIARVDFNNWLTVPESKNGCRYALRTIGKNPIIVMGVNPSDAHGNIKDPTIRCVEMIGKNNNYDSFIMINICARRSTQPTDLEEECNEELHKENINAIKWVLERIENPVIWAAWGKNIETRKYLKECLQDIVEETKQYNVKWVVTYAIGNGHPKHPLYTKRNDRKFKDFDISSYIKK